MPTRTCGSLQNIIPRNLHTFGRLCCTFRLRKSETLYQFRIRVAIHMWITLFLNIQAIDETADNNSTADMFVCAFYEAKYAYEAILFIDFLSATT